VRKKIVLRCVTVITVTFKQQNVRTKAAPLVHAFVKCFVFGLFDNTCGSIEMMLVASPLSDVHHAFLFFEEWIDLAVALTLGRPYEERLLHWPAKLSA
jgi:hypothetical protein